VVVEVDRDIGVHALRNFVLVCVCLYVLKNEYF
jgi:hypothetical protein